MAALKYTLGALQVLSVFFCVNIFIFDQGRRSFKRHAGWHLCLKLVHYILILPMLLLFTALMIVVVVQFIFSAIENNLQGDVGVDHLKKLLVCGFVVSRYGQIFNIVLMNKLHLVQLRQVLNDFAGVYDQYVALFGHRLRLNWFAGAILCMRTILLDILAIASFLTLPAQSRAVYSVLFITSGMPSVALIACLQGLLLLDALFRGAGLAGQHPFWRTRLRQQRVRALLKFYGDLIRLRRNLEPHLRPFLLAHLLVELVWLIIMFHNLAHVSTSLRLLAYSFLLIYPALLANLCHQICEAQQQMATELLTLECEYVAGASSKMVELFYLQKILIESGEYHSWRLLYLRRSFILAFINFAWINGMLMETIYLTSTETIAFDCELRYKISPDNFVHFNGSIESYEKT